MKTIIEPQKVIQVDHSAVYDEYQKAIKYIGDELKSVYRLCENTSTIGRSNYLFFHYLERAKREAFAQIKSLVKPYVVYQVNRYYSYHYLTN